MALSRPGEEERMGFIQHWGRLLGVKQVTVTPGGEAPGRRIEEYDGLVKPESVDFEVDTPVFEGDVLEWDDRGVRRRVHVTQVDVFDAAAASSFMQHVAARYSTVAPPPRSSRMTSGGGHTIIVNGSHVNVAVDGSTVTQQLAVSPGYEKLADAVGRALAVIEETSGVDPDEIEAARESATLVVQEVAKPAPNEKAIKRALTVVKGVLTSAANAGAGALASGLISQLVLGS